MGRDCFTDTLATVARFELGLPKIYLRILASKVLIAPIAEPQTSSRQRCWGMQS